MVKDKAGVMATIDVGSNSIRMLIAQLSPAGEIITLEDLHKSTHIGRDSFVNGRIQVETIHETCDVLRGFNRLMQDYKVKYYRAVSTSGIREAQNREYVLEQIRIRSDLKVEVINSAQERFLMLKAMRNYLSELQPMNKSVLIVHIGSGGVELSVYSEGNLKFTEYIKIGSLRLREVLAELEKKTLDFPSLMEEFIKSRLDFLEPLISSMNIESFIGLGGELRTITGLCKGHEAGYEDKFIEKKSFKKLYEKLHTLTSLQIGDEFGLSRSQAGVLLPSVLLFNIFLEMTHASNIYAPLVSLRHGLITDMADELLDTDSRRDALEDIIGSVWHLGKKYSIDEVHCAFLEKISLSIFDQMGKIHRLGDRERLYLRVASILHDIGKYVNHSTHDIHSYNIVKFLDIMGFSDRELELVANIVRYHSIDIPDQWDENYSALSPEDQIIVSKLAAILRITEALDITHKQKIQRVEVHNSGKELHFDLWASEDMLLEEWSFSSHTTFFEEVMGYRPVLKSRRV